MSDLKDQRGLVRRLDDSGVPALLARLAVGGWFAYLATMKLLDPIAFLKLVRQYNVLPLDPPVILNMTAAVLPWLELVCAAALVLGFLRRGAALVIAGMLAFFTPMLLLHAVGLLHDPTRHFATFCAVKFDCGCGTGEVFICHKLTENVALFAGTLIALFSRSNRFGLAALLRRRQAAPSASRPALAAVREGG